MNTQNDINDSQEEAVLEIGKDISPPHESEDSTSGTSEPDDAQEEIEIDDLKVRLPKAHAEKIKNALRRGLDYERIDQELAERRRLLDTNAKAFQELNEQELTARAQLMGLDQQLRDLQNINWAQELSIAHGSQNAQRAAQVHQAYMHFQQLKDQRAQVAAHQENLLQARTAREAASKTKQAEENRAALEREFPDWSEQKSGEILKGGIAEYGFYQSEIEDLDDPRMVRVLNDALTYRANQKQQKRADSHAAAQISKPAANMQARSGPPLGLDDRLSADEWVKRRNAQLRQRS